MAQNATIYKVELSVSDMDRHYYETHKLTVAKHPSETDERLMVRIIAFALNAHDNLEMTKGISTEGEPDIWQKSLSGELEVWVALGWDKIKASTVRFANLQVTCFTERDIGNLARVASRTMKLQVNIQDGDVMVGVGDTIVNLTLLNWKSAA